VNTHTQAKLAAVVAVSSDKELSGINPALLAKVWLCLRAKKKRCIFECTRICMFDPFFLLEIPGISVFAFHAYRCVGKNRQ
jgi:hypothetical protein